jgi:hypothetical protein
VELHAYTRSISDLLSVKKTYIVPRFQREYSWTKEQVTELWEDTFSCLHSLEGGSFEHEEYFIGALVLVGSDKASAYQIVDGQQRLTTLTIALSVLCERFIQIGRRNLADAIYQNYIAGTDDEGNDYFKLQNESPRPFFQKCVQHIDKAQEPPQTTEEETLFAAYTDLLAFTDRAKLATRVGKDELSDSQYENLLKAVRDQLVSHLKVIFITVAEEEEAYTIFETLNARGMNLSFVDLIKNRLFKELAKKHPDDDARTTWKKMRSVISSRENVGGLEAFIRHWWISRYSYVSAENVYKRFKRLWHDGEIDAADFLAKLHQDAELYVRTSAPQVDDFKSGDERQIYFSLSAFRTFNVTQQRPFVLSLFRAQEAGIVTRTQLMDTLLVLEKFHFLFNAVCSQRPSGIEASYSRAARGLVDAKNKVEARKVLETLHSSLSKRVPDKATFTKKFSVIRYSKQRPKNKRLVQYILHKMVRATLRTAELVPSDLTIEHIMPQSSGAPDVVGQLGNLLPLGRQLNGDAANKSVQLKLAEYAQSEFPLTASFAESCSGTWGKEDVVKRTGVLCSVAYDKIWAL